MKPGTTDLPLSEIANIGAGNSAPQNKQLFKDGAYPFFRTSDIGRIKQGSIFSARDSLNDQGIIGLRRHPKGTILFPKSGASTFLNHRVIMGIDGFVSSHLATIYPNDQIVDGRYLFYYLTTIRTQDLVQDSKYPSLTLESVKSIAVRVPPLHEQRRIVDILDKAFESIAIAKANTEKNFANASELFESELALVFSNCPESWRTEPVGRHVVFIDYRGRTPKKTPSGLKLITAKNIRMGFVKDDPAEFIDPKDYAGWMTRGIPQCGDVLFTTEAPLANVAQLVTHERVAFAQRVIVMHPDHNVLDSTFLKYVLMSSPMQRLIHDKGTGATATGIKASLLKQIPIRFPGSISEQHGIVERLDKLSTFSGVLSQKYDRKNAALDGLKQSVLHAAFSGEL